MVGVRASCASTLFLGGGGSTSEAQSCSRASGDGLLSGQALPKGLLGGSARCLGSNTISLRVHPEVEVSGADKDSPLLEDVLVCTVALFLWHAQLQMQALSP